MSFYIHVETIRRALFELEKIYEGRDITVSAGAEIFIPSENGIKVDEFRTKTIALMVNYSFQYWIEVSDDGTNFYNYFDHNDASLVTDKINTIVVDEDFMYLRVRIKNPDTSNHNILYISVKGRRI